jgi:hypothetical protein
LLGIATEELDELLEVKAALLSLAEKKDEILASNGGGGTVIEAVPFGENDGRKLTKTAGEIMELIGSGNFVTVKTVLQSGCSYYVMQSATEDEMGYIFNADYAYTAETATDYPSCEGEK